MLGNKQSPSSGDRRGRSVGFKSGSVQLGRQLVLNCRRDGLRGGVGGVSGGGWGITCSVVAGVPEDTSTDHSRGLWDK